jgi:hypothetical protein
MGTGHKVTSSAVSFRVGDAVRIRTGSPPNHFRTPEYVQGKQGRVEALCGIFPNPESLAHGGGGRPHIPLYRIEFRQKDLWPDYSGPADDRLLIDIYEHWLDPVTGPRSI